ncbi:MAG: hypothetical protein IJ491_08575 [Clostridia bacterium]|nr:hypothetical protein [Clostridia bacterium]
MSDKNNGISPFRNQEYLQSSSSKNNKYKKQVTEKDIDEFEKVFSDEDPAQTKGTDGKGFFASFRTVKDKSDKSPHQPSAAPVVKAKEVPLPSYSTENLYAEQEFDIDAFMQSLGASPAPKKSEKPVEDTTTANDGHTRAFSLSKKQEKPKASQRTRHFNLSDSVKEKIQKSIPVPEENSDIMHGVRVLSEDKPSDEAILEAAPTGEGKESLLDSVSPEKGEDIFAAVDKAVKRRKSLASQGFSENGTDSAKKRAKKKKEEQTLLTGKALRASLIKKSKREKLQLLITLVLFFISLVFTALPMFYSVGNSLEYMFANGGRIYASINIIMLLLVAIVFFRDFASAVESIADLRPNADTCLLLVTLFALIHNVATLTLHTAGLNGVKMYTIVVIFAAGIKVLGEYFKTRTALRSLITIMKSRSLQSVQPVENKADANSLAQGITEQGDPNILYCAQVETGDNLTAGVGPRRDESRYYTYVSIAVLLSGFIMAAVLYFRNKDGAGFMTALLSTVCLCMPIMSDTVRAVNVYFENLKLNKLGAAATEYEGIRSVGKANGVAMDISDIFTAEVSRFRVIPGVRMDKNDAAVYASAVTIAADSLTGKCFADFIKQLDIPLPEAENIQYEERLGYTAWVNDKRVLVGNREMLIQHSIPAPDEKDEKRYAKNKFVMYLAVEGDLVATFLVNYKVLSSIRKLSYDFNRTGLVLMLTSKEPYLSHKEIAKRLSLDTAGVKVLSSKGSDIINEYRTNKARRISSGLVCSKKNRSLLPLVVATHRLYVSDKFLYNIHILGQCAGLLLLVLSHLLNMPLFFSPLTIVILHILWSVGAYFLSAKREKN